MRRMLILLVIVAMVLVALAPMAFAHDAGPCNESGEPGNWDYAQHHIVPLATTGGMGNDGHVPGTHQGFSACDPSG